MTQRLFGRDRTKPLDAATLPYNEHVLRWVRAEHAAAPFERHFFWAIWPGVDVATANRSVRLFAEEVIPALRDL